METFEAGTAVASEASAESDESDTGKFETGTRAAAAT